MESPIKVIKFLFICPNEDCKNILGKKGEYCPECGNPIMRIEQSKALMIINNKNVDFNELPLKVQRILNPKVKEIKEPHVSTAKKIWLILALIFIFPIGLIACIYVYYDYNKKLELWQRERIISRL